MTAKTNDELFVKEFKEMMIARQMSNRATASSYMQYLKYPEDLNNLEGLPNLEFVMIKGIPLNIKDEWGMDFSALNRKIGQIMPVTSVPQKQRFADASIAKNSKGEVITKDVPVPKDSLVVITTARVGMEQGKKTKRTNDFMLVDVVNKKGKNYYVYFIPKAFLYKVNLCSLIATPNRQRKFYKGYEIALTAGIYMYLFVVPYKEGKEEARQIISTKASFDFDNELNSILRLWVENNIMFNPNETRLEQGVEDTFRIGDHRRVLNNIGILELEPTLMADDYTSSVENNIAKMEYLKSLEGQATDEVD